MFQEYDFEVIVKPRKLNLGHDHLSCILLEEDTRKLDEILPYMHLFIVQIVDDYFANIIHFFSTRVTPPEFTVVQNKKLVVKEEH